MEKKKKKKKKKGGERERKTVDVRIKKVVKGTNVVERQELEVTNKNRKGNGVETRNKKKENEKEENMGMDQKKEGEKRCFWWTCRGVRRIPAVQSCLHARAKESHAFREEEQASPAPQPKGRK